MRLGPVKIICLVARPIFAAAFFLCLLGTAPFFQAMAQNVSTISEIRVEGIQRIEPETVKSYMRIRAGDPFDAALIDESLKSLFVTGLFRDVSIRRDGIVLIVKVSENPVISRLAFEGNDVTEDERLRKEVQLRPRVVYTRTRVQSDVDRIINIYRAQGRFAVKVVPKVIQQSQNRVDLIFEIDEGEPTLIRKISFIGNKAFSDSRLKTVVLSGESHWYSFLTASDVYDPNRVTFDGEMLRRYYHRRGYADFALLSSSAELSQDQENFFLTFTLEEGNRYRFGEVTINSKLKGLDVSKLKGVTTFQTGDWYDGKKVEDSVNNLVDAVGNLGFAFIDIRPKIKRDREKRTVTVTFDINEGNHVFVERIDIHGNVRTMDKVIRREFRLAEGDAFNRSKMRRSRQRINGLGYFKKATVTQKPGSVKDKTVLDVAVEEQSTGTFSVGAGVSSTSGLIAQVQLSENNLLGKGQHLKIQTSLGEKTQNYSIGFTEPYFMDRNFSAGFDLFNVVTKKTDSITFEQNKIGFGLRAGFAYNEHLNHSLRYRFENKEVSSVDDDASLSVKRQEGQSISSSIGQTLSYDARDNKLDPTEGFVVRLSNDLAGLGGGTRYLRSTLSGDNFITILDDWVFRLSGEVGYILGLGEDVRIDDRFFLGGDSFRGFAQGGIGPRDDDSGDALGGVGFVTATAELAFPIGNSDVYKARGFVFSDVGTLRDSTESGSGIHEDDMMRASLGAGIGIKTPLGVIRFNYAVPVLKADFDKEEKFSFQLGTGF